MKSGKATLPFPIFLILPMVPLFLVIFLGFCYSQTIAPGLTWAYFSADGGDLISAVATGGVPHPGGYPLYLILARIFQFLPVGDLAFRTNLLSEVCMILAVLLLYVYLLHQLRNRSLARFSSFLAALIYGLAPFVWGQALVTEVYALHGLLMIICIYVLSVEEGKSNEYFRGVCLGLAAANHLSSIMIFPLLLVDFEKEAFISLPVLAKRSFGVLAGLSLYLILPVRAYFNPPVNWGNAATFNGFVWLISGKLYQAYSFNLSMVDMLQRLRAFIGLLLGQFTWIGVLIGIYGVISLTSNRIRILTFWITGVFLLFSIFYGSNDSQVNLLPVWLCFSIWLGYGLQDLFLWLGTRTVQMYFAGLLSVLLMLRILILFPSVDLSRDHRAMDFINLAFKEIPQNAIVVVNGDEGIFSLWYGQLALGMRPDMVIIAEGLLRFDWYSESLQSTYMQANIPDKSNLQVLDLIAANPDRVICYISLDKKIYCKDDLPGFR
jgi:hypothetical protein